VHKEIQQRVLKVMKKNIGIALVLVVTVLSIYGWNWYQEKSSKIIRLTPETKKALKRETDAQREDSIVKPEPLSRGITSPSDEKNIYFGDLHIHTALSFDSYLFGNRVGLKDAYRFANAQAITTEAGEVMKLNRPWTLPR